jgi:hypothetical protein
LVHFELEFPFSDTPIATLRSTFHLQQETFVTDKE